MECLFSYWVSYPYFHILYMTLDNERGGSKRGKKRPFETPSAVDFYDSMDEEGQEDESKGG